MSQINIQTLFELPEKRRSAWRCHLTSGTVHVLMFLLLALITVPAVREMKKSEMHATLVAPVIPAYDAKINAPREVSPRKLVLRREAPPVKVTPAIKPRVVVTRERKQQILAAPPEIKPIEAAAPAFPLPKIVPPPPKPEVRTAVFQPIEQAKAQQTQKVVSIGGFGDPNGVRRSSHSHMAAVAIASVGSFDLPAGSANGGGGGRGGSGGVRPTSLGGFGDGGVNATSISNAKGSVQTGGFADTSEAATPATDSKPAPAQPALTPVEILYKPKPAYTQEARALKIEGEVSLEVVFTSTGSIRVLRVTHGLGHGLDEAAQQAATQVKFRPATRGGVPVDTNATINITFELT